MKRINRTTNLGDKIKDTTENFKKEFLCETVQKTKGTTGKIRLLN